MVYCHLFVTALIRKTVKWKRGEVAFVVNGFCNWKDEIAAFRKHEGSECHKSAVEAIETLPSQCTSSQSISPSKVCLTRETIDSAC